MAVYLYYQTFKHYEQSNSLGCYKGKKQCYKHEEQNMEKDTKEVYERFYDKIILSEDEEAAVIRKYALLE